jgi:hypothetical protein
MLCLAERPLQLMILVQEMTEENYAVDELHQTDQVMQYQHM